MKILSFWKMERFWMGKKMSIYFRFSFVDFLNIFFFFLLFFFVQVSQAQWNCLCPSLKSSSLIELQDMYKISPFKWLYAVFSSSSSSQPFKLCTKSMWKIKTNIKRLFKVDANTNLLKMRPLEDDKTIKYHSNGCQNMYSSRV